MDAKTIMVKKADGTFARMTLEEVAKLRDGQPQKAVAPKPAPLPTPAPAAVAPQPTPAPAPKAPAPVPAVKAQPATVAAPVPPTEPKKTTPPPTAITKEDSQSLLEEAAPEAPEHLPKVSVPRQDQVDNVLHTITFPISAGNRNRLRTIIQLRLKDIRSSEQTKEVLMRREIDGGMGLTEEQADTVVATCEAAMHPDTIAGIVPLKAPAPKGSLPMMYTEELPATATPNNPFRHAPAAAKAVAKEAPMKMQPTVAPSAAPTAPKEPSLLDKVEALSLASQPAKTSMRDVAAAPVELGPLEEIRLLTLTDFRRLSGSPVDAAKRVEQKLKNLKDESIMQYLAAKDAWHQSPLYREYLAVVAAALAKKVTLAAETAGTKDHLNNAECLAIIGMNSRLA